MDREYVQSSNLKSIGYDPNTATLEVEFHNGAIWQYYDVLESTFHELKSASSVGKYFNSNIKGQYSEGQIG
ncbi:MAG TPA: KTSC domain-containing protein [Saprospiraceae bacterium]|nr:KTSC domain-containing protein [Saprospiraceae bacterium]